MKGIKLRMVTIPNTELDINYVEVRCLSMSYYSCYSLDGCDVEAVEAAPASKKISRGNFDRNIRNVWSQPNEKLHNFAD